MNKLLFIFFLLPLPLFAQTYFGVKGIGSVSYPRGANQKARGSASGGLFVQEDLSKHLSLRQEALFSLDGYYFKEDMPDKVNNMDTIVVGVKTRSYQLNYIELPVSVILKTGDKIKPYFQTGFSLKFNVYSKLMTQDDASHKTFENIPSNGFDFSFINSIGVETTLGKTPSHIELRYTHGNFKIVNGYKLSSFGLLFGFKI